MAKEQNLRVKDRSLDQLSVLYFSSARNYFWCGCTYDESFDLTFFEENISTSQSFERKFTGKI